MAHTPAADPSPSALVATLYAGKTSRLTMSRGLTPSHGRNGHGPGGGRAQEV
jgi:hypothetical protein